MAVQTASAQMTLLELAKRTDPDGEIASIVEVLTEENEILADIPFMEANDRSSHKITRRTTQPSGSWRKINSGVAAEASKTQEVREGIGMLETYSEVDVALAKLSGDENSFRNTEAMAFMEGLSQTWASALIYGNQTTNPERFDGLATRMPSLAATTNVIGQGGTGSDLTSIYIVNWGLTKVHGIYPQGHKSMGIQHRNLGEETKVNASNLMYQVYRDWFGIKTGLVVRDPRCLARLANIEDDGNSNLFSEDNLITLMNRMPKSGAGAKLYVNDTVQTQMEIRLKDKSNVYYTAASGEGLAGVPILRFRGSPVRKVDKIKITEAALT